MGIRGYRYEVRINGTVVDSTSFIENSGELFLHYAENALDTDIVDLFDTFTDELIGRSTPIIEALEVIDYDNCNDIVATFTPDQFDNLLASMYGVPASCLR